jgi:formate dehydrogenase iron-sulfur subunit
MNGMLIDTTKCTACERCVSACVDANGLDSAKADYDRAMTEDGLSSNRWVSVQPVAVDRFVRKSCMHCLEPSCEAACLVGAITKTSAGPVVYDTSKCIGCRYCMLACPFHIPRYEWDQRVPFMRKCDMCATRLERGEQPACVEACPHDALLFGPREELLKEAHATIRHAPESYLPQVWGETEFGGTSVLYISDVSLAPLGWPDRDTAPIPALTEPLISKTPFIGMGVAIGLVGLNWIIKRRMALAGNDHAEQVSHDEG